MPVGTYTTKAMNVEILQKVRPALDMFGPAFGGVVEFLLGGPPSTTPSVTEVFCNKQNVIIAKFGGYENVGWQKNRPSFIYTVRKLAIEADLTVEETEALIAKIPVYTGEGKS